MRPLAHAPSEAPPDSSTPPGERVLPYVWAVGAVSIGLVLRSVLTPWLGTELPYITLFPAVFVAAYLGGLGPTLAATSLSVLATIYLFIDPRFSFALAGPVDRLGVGLYVLSGVATAWLGEARLQAQRRAAAAAAVAEAEAMRAEEETVRAEEEAARAEEERLRAEEEAARAEEGAQHAARLAAIVASSDAGIVGKQLDGTVTSWNAAAERIFGYTAEEMIGRSIYRLIPPELHATEHEVLQRIARGEPLEFSEAERIRKDGQRITIALTVSPIRDGSGNVTGASSIKRDITAQKRTQAALAAAEERIRQTERMDVIGQLAGGVAHEANNQMTVVLGAADFLLRRADLPEPARKDLEQIRAAAERTAAVTAQLLAFSRRQVLQPQVFDLDEAVQGLESVLRRAVGAQSTLVLQLRARPRRVKADPGQLAQVLLNLALNARDAMPLGGRLTVETTVTELTERYAQQHPGVDIQPGRYTMLAVSDTGHGMSAETMRRIFEPFYTTKPVGKGTGLGLATVYGIVKQSGGYIWAYSELGRGTTFKVYLPLDDGSLPEVPARPAPARARGEIVLVVEDEPAVRYMASRALQEHGYGVVEANNGHEALKVVERSDGPIHALVTDVVMPGMDGPELARRVAERWHGLPVLFMSGYTDDEVVRRGLLNTGQPFMQKPFTPEALVQRVAELLKRSSSGRG